MIKNDPNAMPFSGIDANQGGDPEMRKLQLETQETVIDGTPMITPWQTMPVTSDPHSKVKSKPDARTNPGQGFVKRPDMPKLANLTDIKVNL